MKEQNKKKKYHGVAFRKHRLVLALLAAQGLAFTASATDNVTIEPVISNGKEGSSGNEAPNLWFTIDDSGSMGSLGTGVYGKGKTGYKGRLSFGYIPYDPTIAYEDYIPVDHLGNKLPLPSNLNRTYKLGPGQGTNQTATSGTSADPKSLYSDIFITYAREHLGFIASNSGSGAYSNYATKTWSTVADHPTIKITRTARIIEPTLGGTFYYSGVENDTSCIHATNKTRCQVWKTYYSSKMLALKSGLSLALYKHRDADFRFGFQSFWYQDSTSWSFNDWDISNIDDAKIASTRWGIFGEATDRMDERVNLFPLKKNTDDNRKALFSWLFTLVPESGTPTRIAQSYLFHQLKLAENGGSPTGSIYRADPTKDYDKDDNPANTCRQNHNIVFTDGQWETSRADGTDAAIKAKMANYNQGTTESSSITLPDGNSYSAKVPFKATPILGNRNKTKSNGAIQLADIAFQGWITDLDGDASNNKEGDDGALIVNYTEYKDTDGKPKIYENKGSKYWHPFNDPATWQHVNTHAVGFGLDTSQYGNISVNAPETTTEAATLDNTWGLNKIISGDKVWQRSTWANEVYGAGSLFIPGPLAEGDLARAAVAGRGLFYNAQSGEDVLNAFDRIIKKVLSGGDVVPASSGAGGTAGGSQNLDNSYYATRYDKDAFTGELIKKPLYNGSNDPTVLSACFNTYDIDNLPVRGTACDKGGWNAAEIVTAQATRHIITGQRADQTSTHADYTMVNFEKGELSTVQKTTLINNFPTQLSGNFGNNDNRLEKLIDYIKGSADEEVGGTESQAFRSRIHTFADDSKKRNILGAMIRSSAVFVGIPSAYVSHFAEGDTELANYTTYVKNFIDNNTSGEKEMLYVGANDGMLHALKANTGEEVFAYMPNLIYNKLPNTVVPEEQLSLVDGNIDVQSVYFGTQWYRALAAGLGGGGKGFFALNVTPASGNDTPTATSVKSSSKVNWEYGELESKLFNNGASNVGNIMAKPAIVQLQDDTWVAIVGNGYNAESNKAAVIVINLETGEAIQELVIDTANTYSDTSKPNGLGPLYFVSYPGKAMTDSNKYDRAYAGDLQGNLWVFDLTASNKTSGDISIVNNKPLFSATDDNGDAQPITVFPRAVRHPLGYGYLVHFGTGALFAADDLSSKVGNSIYAIWDDWVTDSNINLPGAPASRLTSAVEKTQLNDINLATTTVGSASVRYLDNASKTNWWLEGAAIGSNHRGWKIDLIEGERAWQPSYVAYGDNNSEAIAYNTVKYENSGDDTSCSEAEQKVLSWQLAFNIKDASQTLEESGSLDVNGDNQINSSDKVTLTANGSPQVVSGLLSKDDEGNSTLIFNSTTQRIQELNLNPNPNNSKETCHFTTQMSSNAAGNTTPTTVKRCSYFSSWSELK